MSRKASITLHIQDDYLAGVVVATNMAAPSIGRTVTPAESLGVTS